MELAVLAAGVDTGGQLGEQALVVAASTEVCVECVRVDADERRLEARVEELAGERGGVAPPERKEPALTGRGETTLPVGTDISKNRSPNATASTPRNGAPANASAIRAS